MKITNVFFIVSLFCAAQMSGAQSASNMRVGDRLALTNDYFELDGGHGDHHGGGGGGNHDGDHHGDHQAPPPHPQPGPPHPPPQPQPPPPHPQPGPPHPPGPPQPPPHPQPGPPHPPPQPYPPQPNPPHPQPPYPGPGSDVMLERYINVIYTGYNRISLSSLMNLGAYRGFRVESVEVTARNFDNRSTQFILTEDGRYQDQGNLFGTSYQTFALFPGYASEIGRDFWDLSLEIQGAAVVDYIVIRLSRY